MKKCDELLKYFRYKNVKFYMKFFLEEQRLYELKMHAPSRNKKF